MPEYGDEELQAECDRWERSAREALAGARVTPAPAGWRKYLDATLRAIVALLMWPDVTLGLVRFVLCSMAQRMLENLEAGGRRAKARGVYLSTLAIIDQANQDEREPMKALLPVAQEICDAACELML